MKYIRKQILDSLILQFSTIVCIVWLQVDARVRIGPIIQKEAKWIDPLPIYTNKGQNYKEEQGEVVSTIFFFGGEGKLF